MAVRYQETEESSCCEQTGVFLWQAINGSLDCLREIRWRECRHQYHHSHFTLWRYTVHKQMFSTLFLSWASYLIQVQVLPLLWMPPTLPTLNVPHSFSPLLCALWVLILFDMLAFVLLRVWSIQPHLLCPISSRTGLCYVFLVISFVSLFVQVIHSNLFRHLFKKIWILFMQACDASRFHSYRGRLDLPFEHFLHDIGGVGGELGSWERHQWWQGQQPE